MKKLVTPILATLVILGVAVVSMWIHRPVQDPRTRQLLVSGSYAGYVDPQTCRGCHVQIASTYLQTGMGRSFTRLRPETAVEDWSSRNVFRHAPSERVYSMIEREGRYFQRRHQVGPDGREENVLELEIHFVLGSGNHARSYIHRTADGRLFQLPVTWYSEKGGFWAMSPGYDRADHYDFRRRITHECIFCHNGYPAIEPGSDTYGRESKYPGSLPEGIDCQRCHGPGRAHIEAAGSRDVSAERVRSAVVNPARLPATRQIELCMQCHLETTSARLPPYIRRFDRGFFSYRPGEPLADYILHFDHAPGQGHDDKFEIVSAPYRLRLSACFQKSNGALQCTTCHNPHDVPRGEEAARHYASVCMSCHREGLDRAVLEGRHAAGGDCTACHMPKRRTDDVIHVVMTDHNIQRRGPSRDLIAPLQESRFYGKQYQGEIVRYYPEAAHQVLEGDLYLAVAQVTDSAALATGVRKLEEAIARRASVRVEFHLELAAAQEKLGNRAAAIESYRKALEQEPDSWTARRGLGLALYRSGRIADSAVELEKAASLGVELGTTLTDLAVAYYQLGRVDDAINALERAIRSDPGSVEPRNNLGGLLLDRGQGSRAESEFREAIRLQPDFAAAQHNLARLLAARGDQKEALRHFERAVKHGPTLAQARYDYALALAQEEDYGKAEIQLAAALRLREGWTEAENSLGEILLLQGKRQAALASFQQVLARDPDHLQARFNLGSLLALSGERREALLHLERVAAAEDPSLRRRALEILVALRRGGTKSN